MIFQWLYLVTQIVVATLCVILGIYILQANGKSPRNIHFAINSLFLFLVIVATILIQLSSNETVAKTIQGIYNILLILFLLASLHFSLLFTNTKPKPLLVGVLVSLSLVICILFLTRIQSLLVLTRISELWVYEIKGFFFWYLLYTPFLALIIIIMVITLYRYSRSAITAKDRLQSRTMTIGILISCTGGYLFLMILPLFRVYRMPLLTPCFFAIYLYGVFHALNKYKLMVFSIRNCIKDILSQIGDALILTDEHLRILETGGSAERLLPQKMNAYKGQFLSKIVLLNQELEHRLQRLIAGKEDSFTVRLIFNPAEEVITDTIFTRVTDRFGDFSVLLAVAQESRGIPELKRYFKLTDRELEILLLTISGLSNGVIGEKLNVTRRTVETHQTNIYNKMGIGNKLELIALTADFGIKA